MDEYINKLNNYLPIDFANEENNEYRQYLIETYIENCEKYKYQFALMAFHMMFMSFLYKEFWGLKTYSYSMVERLCNNNGKFKDINHIFDASVIPEQTVVDQYLCLFSWHPNKRSAVKAFVDTRDKCAHASGFVQFQKDGAERYFLDVIEQTEKISNANKSNIIKIFSEQLEALFMDRGLLDARTACENALSVIQEFKLSCWDIHYILSADKPEAVKSDDSGILKVFYYFTMIQMHSEYIKNSSEYFLELPDGHFVDLLYIFIDTCAPETKEMLRVQIEDELTHLDSRGCNLDYKKIRDLMQE